MNPLNTVSRMLVDRLSQIANDVATNVGGGGRLPAMLAARRNINAVPLPGDPASAMQTMVDAGVGPTLRNAVKSGDVVAGFQPSRSADDLIGTAVYPESRRDLMAHEMNHGYWEAARKDPTGMPLFMRWLASRAKDEGPGQDRANALMDMFGEVSSQIKGGTGFSSIPADQYMALHASDPELVRAFALLKRIQEASQSAARVGVASAAMTPAVAATAVFPEVE